MTAREIEEIESGLRILSYECDEMLNKKFYGNNLFNLYFLYCGFISKLKRMRWPVPEIKQTLTKFPKLTQPALFVFVPLALYGIAVFFASSLITLFVFLGVIGATLTIAYVKVRTKIRKDLMTVIALCAELRLHLHRLKMSESKLSA